MTRLRVYGAWAGNPKGVPEDVTRCVTSVSAPGRGWHSYQCTRPRSHGKGGLYCKQHDPDVVAARLRARDRAYEARFQAGENSRAAPDRAIRETALREAETAILALRNDATGTRYAVLNEAANTIVSIIDKEKPSA